MATRAACYFTQQEEQNVALRAESLPVTGPALLLQGPAPGGWWRRCITTWPTCTAGWPAARAMPELATPAAGGLLQVLSSDALSHCRQYTMRMLWQSFNERPLLCSLALPASMRAQVGYESMIHTCGKMLHSYCTATAAAAAAVQHSDKLEAR